MSNPPPGFVLTLSCPDRRGIVAAVSRFFFERGCNIVDSAQFGDRMAGQFFLRIYFISEEGTSLGQLEQDFAGVAQHFNMSAQFHDMAKRTRTLILVSKAGHCLVDLLYRRRIGALAVDIPMIVSNHRDLEDVARSNEIAFTYLPVAKETKAAQESALLEIIQSLGAELVVLARYMQILSPALCRALRGRAINIHHSFLPSFKGARPYRQAYERGVKLIGATAHYVTDDLDEGPIIEQAVERVHHGLGSDDLAAVGRDIESVVLARAVKWHTEHRILLNASRTVVFP